MIRKIFVCLICVFVNLSVFAVPATVTYIIDGDTFSAQVRLEDDTKITVRVRIINVDTPELSGACDHEIKLAKYAQQRLGEIIPVNSVVELTDIKDDKYLGRIDARVFDVVGRDVGKVLISEGVGRAYSGGKRAPWCKNKL